MKVFHIMWADNASAYAGASETGSSGMSKAPYPTKPVLSMDSTKYF